MDAVVDPNADFLWDSVSSESSLEKGLVEKAPKTKEEWKEVRRHAIALMEAVNSLRIPDGLWRSRAKKRMTLAWRNSRKPSRR